MRALIKYKKPTSLIQELREEMNDMFENTLHDWGLPEVSIDKKGLIWHPSIEISEFDGKYEVKAQLPGIDKKDIDVEITEDSLTIKGEIKQEHKEEEGNYYRSEFRYGKFMRTLPFPSDVDSSNAKAEYKDGVLTISVPKTEEEKKKCKKLEILD